MVVKQENISLDLFIHPGETVFEVIQERNISQKELAYRTGFSEKHISTIISGQKPISAEFAKKLEYALDIPASFWRNLQTNYDLELINFNEKHNITIDEIKIAKEVKETAEKITKEVDDTKNDSDLVLKMRQLFNLSNLTAIRNLKPSAIYRAQFSSTTSENIVYAWQHLCEKEVAHQTNNPLNLEILKNNLEKIKKVMLKDSIYHIQEIQKLLNEAGVLFIVRDNVRQAPLNGLTLKTKTNQAMIAMTIKGKYIDVFWFTLFHEISHVLNKDYLINKSPLEIIKAEERANKFAEDYLINPIQYNDFFEKGDFSDSKIKELARKNQVLPSIVVGRINKDTGDWKIGSSLRSQYVWSA